MKIFRHRALIIVTFFVGTIGAAFFATDLNIVYDFERIFAEDDPDLEFYHNFREELAPDDNIVFIALPNEADVFEKRFLEKADSLTHTLYSVPHAESVASLTNFFNITKTPFGLVKSEEVKIKRPED